MSLKLSQITKLLGADTFEDIGISIWLPLMWTLLSIKVVCICHMLDQTLFILANFATLLTFQTFDFIWHRFLFFILSKVILIVHVPQKSRLVFIIVPADITSELEVFVIFLFFLHYLLVRPHTLPQIALVDVSRKNMLELTDLAT